MSSTPLSLSSPIYDEIAEKVRKSYKNSCICWIEEVKNEALEKEFEKTREEITTKRGSPPEVKQLFHGTTQEAVNNILRVGFDPAYSKIAAYGKGTYFATAASHSKTYAKPKELVKNNYDDISYMFVADVLVGKITTTADGKKTDTQLYDISVNHPQNPTIYSTPYRYGAIPRYVVAFYKGA